MSIWSTLGKIGAIGAAPFTGGASLSALPLIDAVGAGINGATQASASNRGTRLQAQMDQDRLQMDANHENRTAESDIIKKLAQANYLSSGGANFQGTTPYSSSFAPRAASPAQQQAARTMEAELLRRQANPMRLQDYSKNMNPGLWERLGGILGPAASAFGATSMQSQQRLPGQI